MEEGKEEAWEDKKMAKKWHRRGKGGMFGGFYFLSIIGAAVFFVQQVSGFWPIVLAILKAIVWPAFLIHSLFQFLAR